MSDMKMNESRTLSVDTWPISPQYIAGLFDGEGSITISRNNGRYKHYTLNVRIGNNKGWVLQRIKKQFGYGCFFISRRHNGREKVFALTGQAACLLLETILPYLVIKFTVAWIGICFQKHKDDFVVNHLRKLGRYRHIPSDEIELREIVKQTIMKINAVPC